VVGVLRRAALGAAVIMAALIGSRCPQYFRLLLLLPSPHEKVAEALLYRTSTISGDGGGGGGGAAAPSTPAATACEFMLA
jgi:hypothetical protein